MLVADIVRRVRETAGDINVIQFSNATLTDWINDAIRECVIGNSLLQARGSSNTVIGQGDYSLPENFFKLHSVWYDGTKLKTCTLEEFEVLSSSEAQPVGTSTPWLAYVYAGLLNLHPAPDSVKSLVVNYSTMPVTINYSADPEGWVPNHPGIPEAYHNRLVTYCLAQVALQDDDVDKYQAHMIEFTTGVRDLDHLRNQEDDLYPFISVSARDADYYE